MVVVVTDSYKMGRDELAKKLRAQNIDTRPTFYPLHLQPPYKQDGEFPVTDYASKHGIQLPSSLNIREEDIKRVVDALK